MARVVRLFLSFAGLIVFGGAVAYPLGALAVAALRGGLTPGEILGAGAGYWPLLGRSLLLAGSAAVLAVLMAVPIARAAGLAGDASRHPFTSLGLVLPILLPPMVYALGWSYLGWRGVPEAIWCIWVWASWAWPIPAVLIGGAWARRGKAAFEAALLTLSPAGAFARVALPVLMPEVLIALLILSTLFLGDYSVPHACRLVVLATDLLGIASVTESPADVVVRALPVAVMAAVVVLAIRRRFREPAEGDDGSGGQIGAAFGWGSDWWRVVVLAVITCGVPIGVLIWRWGSWRGMQAAVQVYGDELVSSYLTSLAGGLLAIGVGIALVESKVVGRMGLLLCVFVGGLPAAVIGEAVLIAYQPVWWVYNSWLLLVLGHVARFGWLAGLVAWISHRSLAAVVVDQARTDGACESHIAWLLRHGPNAVLLLAGVGVVAALSMADVAMGSLLSVPGIGPVSGRVIEKMHRFEDEMLAALCLWMVIGALPGVALAWVASGLVRRKVG